MPPRKPPRRVSTAVRFPADLHADLMREAKARDLSVNLLVVRAVRELLPRLVPLDDLIRDAD